MSHHERLNSSPEPNEPSGFRALWDYVRRRRQAVPDTLLALPSAPEETIYDIHRNQVAAQALQFFNAVDARAADWIGYNGNIRNELYSRRVLNHGERRHRLDLEGLDPELRECIDANIFTVRHSDDGGQWARYSINCQVGGFIPSVWMQTPDGHIEVSVSHGPERLMFESLHLRRVYNHNQVRNVDTFVPNFLNPYDPPHPLAVSQGWLPSSYTHALYDGIDEAGTVTLLDGQTLHHPTDRYAGKYSAADRHIETVLDRKFPYEVNDRHFLLGYRNQQVAVPFETNVYTELGAITSILRAIE